MRWPEHRTNLVLGRPLASVRVRYRKSLCVDPPEAIEAVGNHGELPRFAVSFANRIYLSIATSWQLQRRHAGPIAPRSARSTSTAYDVRRGNPTGGPTRPRSVLDPPITPFAMRVWQPGRPLGFTDAGARQRPAAVEMGWINRMTRLPDRTTSPHRIPLPQRPSHQNAQACAGDALPARRSLQPRRVAKNAGRTHRLATQGPLDRWVFAAYHRRLARGWSRRLPVAGRVRRPRWGST